MTATRFAVLVSAALGAVLIGACRPPQAHAQETDPAPRSPLETFGVSDEVYDVDRFQPVASYERLDGRASFTLSSNGDVWRLEFSIGGRDDGAATRADCHVRVEGEVSQGNRIDGVIVDGQEPRDGGTSPSGLREVVELVPGGARVIEDNMAELCDVGAEGRYRLVDPARS